MAPYWCPCIFFPSNMKFLINILIYKKHVTVCGSVWKVILFFIFFHLKLPFIDDVHTHVRAQYHFPWIHFKTFLISALLGMFSFYLKILLFETKEFMKWEHCRCLQTIQGIAGDITATWGFCMWVWPYFATFLGDLTRQQSQTMNSRCPYREL